MKNQEKMESEKENNSSATELKDSEYSNVADKEFKIAVIKKFNES